MVEGPAGVGLGVGLAAEVRVVGVVPVVPVVEVDRAALVTIPSNAWPKMRRSRKS